MAPRNTLTSSGDLNDRERAIDETRRDLASTVNEIENRLSPRSLRAKAREATVGKAQSMARNVRDRTEASARSTVETLKENPIPTAMIGVGLAWLFINRANRDEASRWRSTRGSTERRWEREGTNGERRAAPNGGSTVERAAEFGREKVEHAKEGAEEAMDRIRDRSERFARQARRQARTVEGQFENVMQTNPLAIGAIAIGLGFAIGMALPRSEKENELFGPARDRLVGGTRKSALGALEKGEEKLSQAAERVTGG